MKKYLFVVKVFSFILCGFITIYADDCSKPKSPSCHNKVPRKCRNEVLDWVKGNWTPGISAQFEIDKDKINSCFNQHLNLHPKTYEDVYNSDMALWDCIFKGHKKSKHYKAIKTIIDNCSTKHLNNLDKFPNCENNSVCNYIEPGQ